jgi:hypothetical protein
MTDMENTDTPRGRRGGMFAKAAKEAVSSEAQTMRPAMRDDDPRAAAARRAAELRGHLGDLDEGTDQLYVDPSTIPDGWTYNWKRYSAYEWEDTGNQLRVKREGWTPVPASRHPEMMPHNTDANSIIMRDGLVLMECPTEIVEERKRIEIKAARDQVRFKESQLSGTPEGTMTRDHARVKPQIKKSYEAMPIPEE